MPILPVSTLAENLEGFSVRQEQVMCGLVSQGGIGDAGSHHSLTVPQKGGAAWLVEGRPGLNPVAQPIEHQAGVLRVPAGHLAVGPTTGVEDRLWQVPMV